MTPTGRAQRDRTSALWTVRTGVPLTRTETFNTGFGSYGRVARALTLNKHALLERVEPIAQGDRKNFEEAHPVVGMSRLSRVNREKLFAKLIEKNFCDISKYSCGAFCGKKGSVKVLKNQRFLRDVEVSIPCLCETNCFPVR